MTVAGTRPRRSLLFVPADRPDRVEKASRLPADVIILELEDGVARERKEEARAQAGKMLASLDFGDREVALRINRISTPDGLEDLRALGRWPRRPDLLVLPKVESAGEVSIYEEYLAAVGAEVVLIPSIETARGLHHAAEIAGASRRVGALMFGGGDLALDLGCHFGWDSLLPYRAWVIAAGASAGVPTIDVPYIDVHDEPGLRREVKAAREIGMSGKVCIHPAQLEPVNEAFRPTAEEIEKARRIVAATREHGGAALVDGRLVDVPLIHMAERTLAAAGASGHANGAPRDGRAPAQPEEED